MKENSCISQNEQENSKIFLTNTNNQDHNLSNPLLCQTPMTSAQSTRSIDNSVYGKPIGIYNFSRNKVDHSDLEENIDRIVTSFIDQNKAKMIKYVVNEVENKLNEKIRPINTIISDVKNDFNSLYEEEMNDFKELNIMNDCHKHIFDISNKVNIMNENIQKYSNDIKGFSVSDNKLQFLFKLNKDLQEFINSNVEIDKEVGFGTEEERNKFMSTEKKQEDINRELDNIFNETMSMINAITTEKTEQDPNFITDGNSDNLVHFENIITDFEKKFKNEKQCINEKKLFQENNNYFDENKEKNILGTIPDFFDLNF